MMILWHWVDEISLFAFSRRPSRGRGRDGNRELERVLTWTPIFFSLEHTPCLFQLPEAHVGLCSRSVRDVWRTWQDNVQQRGPFAPLVKGIVYFYIHIHTYLTSLVRSQFYLTFLFKAGFILKKKCWSCKEGTLKYCMLCLFNYYWKILGKKLL